MIKNVICPDQSVKLVSIPVIWVIALTLVGYNFEELQLPFDKGIIINFMANR